MRCIKIYLYLCNIKLTKVSMEFLTTEQLPKTKAGLKKAILKGEIKVYEKNYLSESLEDEYVLVTNLDYLFSTWDIFHYYPKSERAYVGTSRTYYFVSGV